MKCCLEKSSILTVSCSGLQYFARPLTTCRKLPSPKSISSTNKLHTRIGNHLSKLKIPTTNKQQVPVRRWMLPCLANDTNLYVKNGDTSLCVLFSRIFFWWFLFLLSWFTIFWGLSSFYIGSNIFLEFSRQCKSVSPDTWLVTERQWMK